MVNYVRSFCLGLLLVVLQVNVPGAFAQTGTSEADSLRFYELSEIVVGGASDEKRAAPVGSVRRVALADIVRTDAPDVAGLTRLIPSAHLQTNSRGESLVYLRGSGERQVAVFLDGALLNVPWDNRVDLSALPASILGGMQVTEGAGSVLYGTNVLGGVVNLSTRSLQRAGSLTEATTAAGSGGMRRLEGMHIRRDGATSLVVAAGFNDRDGYPVGENVELPSQTGSGTLRTNTDRRMAHGYARLGRTWESGEGGISLFHVDAAKGVAPETHIDPIDGGVRFWRYPDWKTTMLAANARHGTAAGREFRNSVWVSRFGQSIDQFASGSYASRTDEQVDVDWTAGFRSVVAQPLLDGSLRSALNVLVSTHNQTDRQFDGNLAPAESDEQYRQITLSLGSEYAFDLDVSRFVVGANLDYFDTPRTGDKPNGGSFSAWGATGSFERDLSAATALHGTIGRKVRFPTMRELYGTALNRFLLNDDLRPESALLADIGLERTAGALEFEVTAFANRTWDTIDQRNVVVEGGSRRQRINLDGSRVLGVELVGRLAPGRGVSARYAATISRGKVLGDSGREQLIEKPGTLITLGATATPRAGTSISAEMVYTGRAYGLDPDNVVVDLPDVLQINLRASARRYTSAGLFGELFVRLDNITDQSVFPQLGLPGPGRTMQVGLSLAY